MTPEERAPILDALVGLSKQDADLADPLTTFLPLLAHRYALSSNAVVILGGRGAGKTALFRLVNDPRTASRLPAFFEDERVLSATWFDAFSQGAAHPEVGTLEALATSAPDLTLRALWMTHLLRRVLETVPGLVPIPPVLEPVLRAPVADLAAWLPAAEANLGAVNATLDAAERALVAADRTVVATYDNLDRIGQFEPGTRRRYASTLLALWLSLATRYKKLRGKIFLRDDLFDAGELGFADASKLRSRAETIAWDAPALYRVVARHLANTSDAMRAWLRDVQGLELRDRGEFGWMPGEMPNGVQRDFMTRLAWRVIGKGVLKVETHLWIVDRLSDANRRVTPRAMLWFFEFAGRAAAERPAGRRKTPLGADDLVAALRRTSRERVAEIREEYPVAGRLENLRGMKLPIDREEGVKRLGVPRDGEPEGIPARGEIILNEMLRLGILREGDKGHLDVPDIYRYSFEIAPDYATAWADFLKEESPSAREQFVRELPRLHEMLRGLNRAPLSMLGEEHVLRKDYDAARAECERALGLVRNAHDLCGEAEILERLASISLEQDDRERSLSEFSQAAEIARRAGLKHEEADLLWRVGVVALSNGNLDRAATAASRSLSLVQHLKSNGDAAASYFLMGDVSRRRGHADEAAEYYKLAFSSAKKEPGLAFWEALALEGLSDIYVANEDFVSGLSLLTLALVARGDKSDSVTNSLSSKRNDLAARLQQSLTQLELLTREVHEIYSRDGGWSIVRKAFPDKTTSA